MPDRNAAFAIDAFVEDHAIDWELLGGGVKRKIMSFDERLMLVKVAFEKNAIGTLHNHPHTQISYVSKGSFEVEIDGEKKVLKAGDVFYAAPGLMHGVVCLEEGELVDVFSPYREDFV